MLDVYSWARMQVPCLTYGMRGMIAASVEVKGPARDLHSGNDGGMLYLSLLRASLCSVDARDQCFQINKGLERRHCAGVFNEPLSDLMKVLASLVDADNHILVKGFLDRVGVSPSLFALLVAWESTAGIQG